VNIPLELRHGDTVGEIEGLFFSLFPKHRGRLVDEFLRDDLSQVGRLIARLHNVGARHPANHRLTYDAHYIEQSLDIIERFIDPNLWSAYCESSEWLLEKYDQEFPADNFIRIHGDCHRGNLLKNETGFFLVDFDDFCNGPVGQDFWMLMSSCESENSEEKERLLSGYRELRALPEPEVNNLELLRAMRIIHYAAWIGRRWQDPFFPQIFPNYTSTGYWNEDLHALQSIIHRIT
jgi:Ser/Thr protein kinase RdoA (MazF antagonist)